MRKEATQAWIVPILYRAPAFDTFGANTFCDVRSFVRSLVARQDSDIWGKLLVLRNGEKQ